MVLFRKKYADAKSRELNPSKNGEITKSFTDAPVENFYTGNMSFNAIRENIRIYSNPGVVKVLACFHVFWYTPIAVRKLDELVLLLCKTTFKVVQDPCQKTTECF